MRPVRAVWPPTHSCHLVPKLEGLVQQQSEQTLMDRSCWELEVLDLTTSLLVKLSRFVSHQRRVWTGKSYKTQTKRKILKQCPTHRKVLVHDASSRWIRTRSIAQYLILRPLLTLACQLCRLSGLCKSCFTRTNPQSRGWGCKYLHTMCLCIPNVREGSRVFGLKGCLQNFWHRTVSERQS